jgi:hypothetical protein
MSRRRDWIRFVAFSTAIALATTVHAAVIATSKGAGADAEVRDHLLSDFIALSLNAGKPTVTIVAAIVYDGQIPVNSWKNFNYLFNPKEQVTLNADTGYDADTADPGNPLGSPWSGANNEANANGFSPFSPQLIIDPDFPFVHEPFHYSPPGSDLLGANGGNAFAGPWEAVSTLQNSNYDIAPGSLSFPDLATSGNRVTTAALGTGVASITRPLSTPIGHADTTQYLSFLIRPEGVLNQGQFNGFIGLWRLQRRWNGERGRLHGLAKSRRPVLRANQ